MLCRFGRSWGNQTRTYKTAIPLGRFDTDNNSSLVDSRVDLQTLVQPIGNFFNTLEHSEYVEVNSLLGLNVLLAFGS